MAICKTDNSIESIRGRFGGVYFKKDSAGQHIQAMPRTVQYARGGTQGGYRDAWSALASLWGLAYVAAVYVSWAAFALAFAFFTHSGVWKYVSGWNWFTHFNVDRYAHGWLPYWKPIPAPDFKPPVVLALEGFAVYNQTPPLPYEDPSDYYWLGGEYNGKYWYESDSKNWNIWWNGAGWYCTHQLGMLEGRRFYHVGDTPYGNYVEMNVPAPLSATATP